VAEHTYLDRHTTVEGTLRSAKDLRIEGRVEGEIVCDGKLTVAEGAVVQARIEAAEVLISGNVQGDVHSHGGLKLLPTAVIRGSSTAARITIEDGATYEGELHMTTDVPRTDEIAETPLAGVLANRERLAATPSRTEPARTAPNGNGSRSGNGARAGV
jgi:cytoskeletal protein CcmA (bactofilin family)